MIKYSVNQLTTAKWSFAQDIQHYDTESIPAVTIQKNKLTAHGVEQGLRLLDMADLSIAAYQTSSHFTLKDPARWKRELEHFKEDFGTAAKLDTQLVIFQAGPREDLSFEEAESAFLSILDLLLPLSEEHNIRLALEHNSALRTDLGYLGNLHNALDLADVVDSPYLTICLEINNAWIERHLYANIRNRSARLGVVQIDDFREGTKITPSRVPLGDGIIPLTRIVTALLEAGYDGYFDLELVGPEIEQIGYAEAIRRSIDYLRQLGKI